MKKLHLLSEEQVDQNFEDIKTMTGAWEDDKFLGQYCENCHIATRLCDCAKDSCDICEDARD